MRKVYFFHQLQLLPLYHEESLFLPPIMLIPVVVHVHVDRWVCINSVLPSDAILQHHWLR